MNVLLSQRFLEHPDIARFTNSVSPTKIETENAYCIRDQFIISNNCMTSSEIIQNAIDKLRGRNILGRRLIDDQEYCSLIRCNNLREFYSNLTLNELVFIGF